MFKRKSYEISTGLSTRIGKNSMRHKQCTAVTADSSRRQHYEYIIGQDHCGRASTGGVCLESS